ncbi:hypothetical protein [Nostoc sp.]|uniref:hypothetical protein n=1 Tax=Nostoc sp. TaxID=1180 RepID=UPI002FF8CEDC
MACQSISDLMGATLAGGAACADYYGDDGSPWCEHGAAMGRSLLFKQGKVLLIVVPPKQKKKLGIFSRHKYFSYLH